MEILEFIDLVTSPILVINNKLANVFIKFMDCSVIVR